MALARSLLLADAVTPTALAEALFLSATRGTSLVRTLLTSRAIDALRLDQVLERGEAPYMRQIAPVRALVERLPAGLCDRLLAIPVRRDPRTGTVDVAVVDARDSHAAEEIGYWLNAPVRAVRTSIASMESALLRLDARVESAESAESAAGLGMRALAPPLGSSAPMAAHLRSTPMYAAPAASNRAKSEPPPEDPDLVIPLTRRNFGVPPVAQVTLEHVTFDSAPVEIGPPAIERTARRGDSDPILDLRRRKPAAARPTQVDPEYGAASTVRGPFRPALPATPVARVPSDAQLAGYELGMAPALPHVPSVPAASADETASVVERMRGARDRDQIFDLLVAGISTVAHRAVVFAVRRDALVGWTGSGEIGDRAALRTVRLPNALPTVLHESLEREGARRARIPTDAAHAPLLVIMRPPTSGQDVVVAAVQAEGRPVAVVMADELGSDESTAIERLGALARGAGEAFGRLLRDRRG